MAENTVSNIVEASISNADDGIVAITGGVTLSATSQGAPLFDVLFATLGLTAANLDDAAVADDVNPATDAAGDAAILASLRTAFANAGETLALVDTLATSFVHTTGNIDADILVGDTVLLDGGHTAGGLAGQVYRFIAGADETNVDLSAEDFSVGTRWELVTADIKLTKLDDGSGWMLVDGSGTAYILKNNTALSQLEVSKSTINAISAAASLAASFGTVAVGLSGAGAFANNVILTTTTAFIEYSFVDSEGSVSISATGTSAITSTVVAASAAISGGAVGVGASIGAAVAKNFIGFEADGTESRAEISAYVMDSSIDTEGDLTQTALASQTIASTVLSGSAALAAGGVGVAASGSGVLAENKIAVDVLAYIDGDSWYPGGQFFAQRHGHVTDHHGRRCGIFGRLGRRRWGLGLRWRGARPQRNQQRHRRLYP